MRCDNVVGSLTVFLNQGPMKAEKGRLQIAAGAQKALPNQISMPPVI